MGEVFTKAQPLSAVGHGSAAGLHPESKWNNPEPEVVLILSCARRHSRRDAWQRCQLARHRRKVGAVARRVQRPDVPSCAVGPFIRLFDEQFTLADVCRLEVQLEIHGPSDQFELRDVSNMQRISRAPQSIVEQMFAHHDYPDGAVLFCGTMFSPTKPRGEFPGFTHKLGDVVTIRAERLGADQCHGFNRNSPALGNRGDKIDAESRWTRIAERNLNEKFSRFESFFAFVRLRKMRQRQMIKQAVDVAEAIRAKAPFDAQSPPRQTNW